SRGFPTKAIWRVISVRCSASRLDSSGGRNASPDAPARCCKELRAIGGEQANVVPRDRQVAESCAWVPTLIRLRLRQRAAVESSQNLGVVRTTLEMLFQNGHECLRPTQGTRRNFFEALPWSAPIDRLPNN